MTLQEDRLQRIELTISHQDQQIQDLSDMVSKQWQEIDRLKKTLTRTEARLGNLENPEDDGDDIAHEVPPHY